MSNEYDEKNPEQSAQQSELPDTTRPRQPAAHHAGTSGSRRDGGASGGGGGVTSVQLVPMSPEATPDQSLWDMIKNRCNAIGFNRYDDFITEIMCGEGDPPKIIDDELEKKYAEGKKLAKNWGLLHRGRLNSIDAYELLKQATDLFLMHECGLASDPGGDPVLDDDGKTLTDRREIYERRLFAEASTSPYLDLIARKLGELPFKPEVRGVADNCYGILRSSYNNPAMIELIWSYWHEEGMLAQGMNAIALRFQNVRAEGARDPLANLTLNPLQPLNNLLWSFIQGQPGRLTLARRSFEYQHQYGLQLIGRAVPTQAAADKRSRFVEALHHLLHRCSEFFRDLDDNTIVADGFPVLNALKDVHMLLSEGYANQYGDLPWTARAEMMIQQWLLARPEMREFLSGRPGVAYPEPWMDRVDTLKRLKGWTDSSIIHFRDLAVYGEQILLSIRFGGWSNIINPSAAANWAIAFRAEIQAYVHAYRSVTGVDLSDQDSYNLSGSEMPSRLLRERLRTRAA